jgi:hypothetical protein
LTPELRVETAYAIDRVEHPGALSSEIAERGQGQGDGPVVAFDVPEANAEEFIGISVRL